MITTGLLIINPDAEIDVSGWVVEVGGLENTRTGRLGGKCFWPGANASTIVSQIVDLSSYDTSEGDAVLTFGGWSSSYTDADEGRFFVRYYDKNDTLLDTQYGAYTTVDTWTPLSVTQTVPANTDYVELCIQATRLVGSDNNFYWDDLYATIEHEPIAPFDPSIIPYSKKKTFKYGGSEQSTDLVYFPIKMIPPSDWVGYLGTIDPFWDYVVTALPGNGDNGSTDIVDMKGKDIYAASGAVYSTADSVFGSSCLYFPSTLNYLRYTQDYSDLELVDNDFCIEMYAQTIAFTNTTPCLISKRTNYSSDNAYTLIWHTTGIVTFSATSDGVGANAFVTLNSSALVSGKWYHIAVTRNGVVFKLFIDGVEVDTSSSSSSIHSNTALVRVGCYDASAIVSSSFHGYVDQLRITNGVARYTEDFTLLDTDIEDTRLSTDAYHKRLAVTVADIQCPVEIESWYNQTDEAGVYPPAHSSTYVKATSYGSSSYSPWFATDPALSLIDSRSLVCWETSAGVSGSQKFNVDVGKSIILNRVYLENSISSGTLEYFGIKDFTVYGTNSSSAFSNVTYSTLTDLTELGIFQAREHVSSNVPDPQYFDLSDNQLSFRYYVLRIATSYGDRTNIRHIEFQEHPPSKAVLHSKVPAVTAANGFNATLSYDETQPDNLEFVSGAGEYLLTTLGDDFTGIDGDAPDPLLWEVSGDNLGTVEILNNQLNIAGDSINKISSVFSLSGDLSVQVDVNIDTGPDTDSWEALVSLVLPSGDQILVSRRYQGEGKLQVYTLIDSTYTLIGSTVLTSITETGFKFDRVSDSVTVSYWNGSSWVRIESVTFSGTVRVNIQGSAWGGYPSYSISYDNFKVNSADAIIGYNPATNVWDANFVVVSHKAQDPSNDIPDNTVLYATEETSTSSTTAIASSSFSAVSIPALTKENGLLKVDLKISNKDNITTGGSLEITSSGSYDSEEWSYSFTGDPAGIIPLLTSTYQTFYIPLSYFVTQGGELDPTGIDFFRWFMFVDASTTISIQNIEIVPAPTVLDSTSYAKHGTSYGYMTSDDLIDGDTGKMIEYDGVDDYTNHGYDAAHDITDTLTLEASFTPSSLLDNSLTDTPCLISRSFDPVDNQDNYAFFVNTDGKLQVGTQGGNIQGTKVSWDAGTNFIVAGTYNSSGLLGDLFIDGAKETLTVDSYDTMSGGDNNLLIGKNHDTYDYFPGAIGEVRISNVVRSDDWIKLTNLSLTDQLGVWLDYVPAVDWDLDKRFRINPGTGLIKPTNVDDGFTGTDGDAPDTHLWYDADGSIPATIDNNKWYGYKSSGVDGGSDSLSTYRIDGDFDVQIDFELLNYPSDTSVWAVGLYLMGLIETDDWAYMYMCNLGVGDYYRGSTKVNGGTSTQTTSGTGATSGQLRITRVGSTLTTYYWNGSIWAPLHTESSIFSDTVQVRIRTYSNVTNSIFEATLDNFKINSGTLVWPDITNLQLPLHIEALTYEDGNDDFTGTDDDAPNPELWTPYAANIGTFVIQSNQLKHTHVGGVTEDEYFKSTFSFSGDFDIQIDFDLFTEIVTDSAVYMAISADPDYMWDDNSAVSGLQQLGGNPVYRGTTKIAGVGENEYVETTDLVGSFRITRVGTVLTVYYMDGSWTSIKSSSGFSSSNMYVILRAYSNTTGATNQALDNFTINSGTVVWPSSAPVKTGSGLTNLDASALFEELNRQDVDDDFTGTDGDAPDPVLWAQIGDDALIQSNKLLTDCGTALEEDGVQSLWQLSDDFDVQVDWEIAASNNINYWEAGILIYQDSNNWFRITRDYTTAQHYVAFDKIDGTLHSNATSVTSDTSGKFRFVYSGTTLTAYTWNGSAWVSLYAWTSLVLLPSTVQLKTTGNGGAVAFYHDNFKVNSGTIVWTDTSNKKIKLEIDGTETTVEIPPSSWDWDTKTAMILADIPDLTKDTEMVLWYDSAQYDNSNVIDVDPLPAAPTDPYPLALYNTALDDELWTWEVLSTFTFIRAVLEQNYELYTGELLLYLAQSYNLPEEKIVELKQYYSLIMLLEFIQTYGDAESMYARLDQYYWDAYVLVKRLAQKYGDAANIFVELEQNWEGATLLQKALHQAFTLSDSPLLKAMIQSYMLNVNDVLSRRLIQSYTIAPDGVQPPSSGGVVGGLEDPVTGDPIVGDADSGEPLFTGALLITAISIEFSINSYCGSCSLNLAKFEQWNGLAVGQPLTIVVGLDTYNFVITDLSKSETANSSTFAVECKSKAVLMDFPHAPEITAEDSEIVYGKSSEIVNRIANTRNQSVTWGLPVDPPQTENTYQVSGKSPLSAIRELINELGGRLQSSPDGSLRAIPHYPVDSDKLATATPDVYYSAATDFITISTDHDKRNGYNIYEIYNESSDTGYTLETEEVTPSHYKVKAYRSPWSTEAVTLRTSELTNVSIDYAGEVRETIEDELLEIVSGTGTTSKPIYSLDGFDYDSRINLGDISWMDSGEIETTNLEESMVLVTYTTRYWMWNVYGTDPEKVQFILETEDE